MSTPPPPRARPSQSPMPVRIAKRETSASAKGNSWRPQQWPSPERQCSMHGMLARAGPPPQARRTPMRTQRSSVADGASATRPDRREKESVEKRAGAEKEQRGDAEAHSLREGGVVQIAGSTFRIKSALGQGSFGAVWRAASVFGDVAIKEISCFSKAALADAEFEGHLLRALSVADGCDPEALKRIPALVSQEAQQVGPTWRVLIAMTKISGIPLSELLDTRLPLTPNTSQECYEMFQEACGLAGELLTQLVPTFEHVANLAYHRDVTPRNILIDSRDTPLFGLIDFGLAVDSAHWHLGGVSPQAGWRTIAVAGDGRYWPVSSWFAFGHGKGELARHPGLCHEYKTCLDIHSLGLTALQVVAEMSPTRPEDSAVYAETQADSVLSRFWRLRSAWEAYWKDATHFWLSIYQTFQTGGDFDELKAEYVKAKVHETICADLSALHEALCDAREACETAGLGCAVVMEALLLMISTGENSVSGSSWRSLRMLLSSGGERENLKSSTTKSPTSKSVSPTSTAAPGSSTVSTPMSQ